MARPPSLSRALTTAIGASQLDKQDAAAIALAKVYAARIDNDPDALLKVGHMMLPVLTALGLTPAARNAVAKGATPDAPAAGHLDQLRARRASRSNRAAAVDPAAP